MNLTVKLRCNAFCSNDLDYNGMLDKQPTKMESSKNSVRRRVHFRVHCCRVCGDHLERSQFLDRNMRMHTWYMPHICSTINSVKNPKNSMHIDTANKFHDCYVCDKQFENIEHLEKHMTIHSDNKQYFCGEQFTHRAYLNRDMLTHTDDKHYFCGLCGRLFLSRDQLMKHMLIHVVNEKNYSCDICCKAFRLVTQLETHILMHTGDKPYISSCDICGKTFTITENLRTHMLTHTADVPNTCSCILCGQKFSLTEHLKDHLLIHNNDVPYCSVCGLEFEQTSYLRFHMIAAHTCSKFEVSGCSLCGIDFEVIGDFQKHMLLHASDQKHCCNFCCKLWFLKGDNKPHLCRFCNKWFSKAATLQTHLLIHTGNSYHCCYICDKQFAMAGCLQRHMIMHSFQDPYTEMYICRANNEDQAVIHDNGTLNSCGTEIEGKPFYCGICDFQFSLPSQLISHMKLHTEEEPIKCDHCNKIFLSAEECNQHLLVHKHGETCRSTTLTIDHTYAQPVFSLNDA